LARARRFVERPIAGGRAVAKLARKDEGDEYAPQLLATCLMLPMIAGAAAAQTQPAQSQRHRRWSKSPRR
jgi:hypothetical protein